MREVRPKKAFKQDVKHANGGREGSRDCHIRPDFLLVYSYEGDDVLWLERLGTHAEILGL